MRRIFPYIYFYSFLLMYLSPSLVEYSIGWSQPKQLDSETSLNPSSSKEEIDLTLLSPLPTASPEDIASLQLDRSFYVSQDEVEKDKKKCK